MATPEKVWESKSTIRFPDCDPFNHLNNARYLDYFINAREDQLLKHLQFSPYAYAKEKGLSWVVTQNQIVYLRPAMLMETVVMESTLLKLNEKDVLVEMRMWNLDKTVLKALLWCRFTHFNLATMRAEVHSPELATQFKPYENLIVAEGTTFEQHVEQMKNKKAAELTAI